MNPEVLSKLEEPWNYGDGVWIPKFRVSPKSFLILDAFGETPILDFLTKFSEALQAAIVERIRYAIVFNNNCFHVGPSSYFVKIP